MTAEGAAPSFNAASDSDVCDSYKPVECRVDANRPIIHKGETAMTATRTDYTNADLRGIDLNYADLTGHNFTGANLEGANLTGALLVDANLTGANLSGASLSDADLKGATLIGANLSRTVLRYTDLSGCNLSGANLKYAYLGLTDLTGSNLNGVDLEGARLVNAITAGATFMGANLLYADIIGATIPKAPKKKPVLRVKAARTPLPRPVLKQLTLPEWAFKLGTNSSQGTDPHEANKVIRWPQYLSAACARGYTYSVWYYYFQLGMQVQNTASLAEVEVVSRLYRKAEDAALGSLDSAQYLPHYVKPTTAAAAVAVRALCSA